MTTILIILVALFVLGNVGLIAVFAGLNAASKKQTDLKNELKNKIKN